MKSLTRVLIEVLGPSFVGTVLFYVFTGMWIFPSFFTNLFFAYVVAIVPSCVYAAIMELWIRYGSREQYGDLLTVVLSTGLGLVAAGAIVCVLPMFCLLPIGIGVGLLLGIVLAILAKDGRNKQEVCAQKEFQPAKPPNLPVSE